MRTKYTYSSLFVLLLAFAGLGWLAFESQNKAQIPQLIAEKSAIGTKENPQARQDYVRRMLVNPRSRQLPENIKRRELRFAQRIRTRGQLQRQKQEEVFQASPWEANGPYNLGGRSRALAIDISNEQRLLAGGVSGGMWLSENEGNDWRKVTPAQNLHSVTSIAQDRRAGHRQVWYYGTGEIQGNTASGGQAAYRGDGIFKSVDGGKSWQLLASTSQDDPHRFNSHFNYVHNIQLNRFNDAQDEVMVAAFGGILRSVDGGTNWELVLGDGLQNASSVYTDIAQSADGSWYAALSRQGLAGQQAQTAGLFRSQDGVNWEEVTPDSWPYFFRRVVIAPAPSNPNSVYVLADSEEYQLWKYDAAMDSWQDRSLNVPDFGGAVGDYDSQTSYNMVLKVHPENEQMVYLGGTNLYRSSDGFMSSDNTDWIGGYSNDNEVANYPDHHPDQHALTFYPSDPDKMLSGHDGGVSLSFNNQAQDHRWVSLNNGYVTAQFFTVAMDPQQEDGLVLGGMQDNGTYGTFRETSGQWTNILGGDGAYCEVAPGAEFVYVSFQNGEVYRVRLNDEMEMLSFARVDPVDGGEVQDQEYLFINPFALDPNNPNKMYLAGGDKIWINSNLTQLELFSQEKSKLNWQPLKESRIGSGYEQEYKHQITALGVSTNPADVLYYGTSLGRLYRASPGDPKEARVISLTNNLLAAADCDIDGVSCLEGAYISSIAVDPSDADKLLVAFSNYEVPSVFYSEDGGQSFTQVSGNLEENPDGSGSGPSVRWLTILPMEEGQNLFFAGTSTGLYSANSLTGKDTYWAWEEKIGKVVVPMLDYRATDGKVVVATHGNGVYSRKYENVRQPQRAVVAKQEFELQNPWPNPFYAAQEQQTKFEFSLPQDGLVTATVFNSQGQPLKTLLRSRLYAGENQISWDGTNTEGKAAPAGVYMVRVEFAGGSDSKRVILME